MAPDLLKSSAALQRVTLPPVKGVQPTQVGFQERGPGPGSSREWEEQRRKALPPLPLGAGAGQGSGGGGARARRPRGGGLAVGPGEGELGAPRPSSGPGGSLLPALRALGGNRALGGGAVPAREARGGGLLWRPQGDPLAEPQSEGGFRASPAPSAAAVAGHEADDLFQLLAQLLLPARGVQVQSASPSQTPPESLDNIQENSLGNRYMFIIERKVEVKISPPLPEITTVETELFLVAITQTLTWIKHKGPQGSNQRSHLDNSTALAVSSHSPQTRPRVQVSLSSSLAGSSFLPGKQAERPPKLSHKESLSSPLLHSVATRQPHDE
ncbi:uncharacterized protein LOC130842240 [Hippopotamus amphibius kiboko]|uniref:uncharacterized protein LOC130842240 n=1 Tax=Hippopotamus amphibius kiboko TaxID=575201 RepID=UPI0025962932|nr:uncharacterized protein LOC130842240 [Hippopotamus amphibius kiboko]